MEAFNLEFKASEKQALALSYLMDNKTKEIGYGGWAGWGKSYIWVAWLWMMCHKYPWTRWFIWRRELSNLMKTTLNSYFKFGEDYKIPQNLMGKLDKKYNIIKFPNRSEILLLDCAEQPSDPLYTRFGSLELTWGFVDESNEVAEQALTILKTRIARQKNREYGILPKLLETFNPDQGHVKQRFWTPYKEHNLPDYRQFIPALATDNKYIDPEYIVQLENSDEITRQRLLYGNFDWSDDEGKVFRFDEVYDLFRNNIEEENVSYLTCDVARLGNDKSVIAVWRWLEMIKVVTYAQNTVDQLANRIKELEDEYEVQRKNICIDSDWVGGGVADLVRGCANFVNSQAPFKFDIERKWFVVKNFSNLKTQCYFKLKELMERRKIRVRIDWQIKSDMSRELENIYIKKSWKDSKTSIESKDDLRKRIGRSSDFADALMMRMYWIVKDLEEHSDIQEWVYEIDYSDVLY